MNKLNYNIRVKGYKMIGLLWYISPLIIVAITWSKNTIPIGDKLGMSLVIPLIFLFITIMLRFIGEIKIFSPSLLLQNPKLIYHDNLGYFSGYTFTGDKIAFIRIYKQNILTLDFIGDININNVSQVQSDVKKLLDKKYQNVLKDIETDKKIKEEKDVVKKWDGYLSVRDRRDSKLEKLLKK